MRKPKKQTKVIVEFGGAHGSYPCVVHKPKGVRVELHDYDNAELINGDPDNLKPEIRIFRESTTI